MTAPSRVTRRQALPIVMQTLYEHDAVRHPAEIVVERIAAESEIGDEAAGEARRVIAAVLANLAGIDSLIAEAAPTWPLSQMARVDKNILRLAIYETFMDNPAVPARVAINDAIELAKTFGSDSSSKFVNGVLATLAERRPDQE